MLPSVLQMFMSPAVGFLSQRLLAQGKTSRVVRGLFGGGCVAIAGIAMILLARSDSAWVQIPLVMISFAIGSVIYTLGPALIGEISPIRQRGAMLGISNAFYTLAGLVAPWLMGHIVDVGANPAAGFRSGFEFGGTVIAIGGLIAMALIHPERDLERFRGHSRDETGIQLGSSRA